MRDTKEAGSEHAVPLEEHVSGCPVRRNAYRWMSALEASGLYELDGKLQRLRRIQ